MAGVLKIAVVPAVPIRSNAFSEEYDGHSMNENVSNARQHEVRCIMCVVTEYFNVLDWDDDQTGTYLYNISQTLHQLTLQPYPCNLDSLLHSATPSS